MEAIQYGNTSINFGAIDIKAITNTLFLLQHRDTNASFMGHFDLVQIPLK